MRRLWASQTIRKWLHNLQSSRQNANMGCLSKIAKNFKVSLIVQWLRLCLLIQAGVVQSVVQEAKIPDHLLAKKNKT